jgi:hypothetical protein
MDSIVKRVKDFFFHPKLEDPPIESEKHRKAAELRESKVVELRAQLKTDPSLDEKINGITTQLLSAGAEPEP